MAISKTALVEVFPSVQYAQATSNETTSSLNSRALGEVGIVNLIKRICSNSSFVLTYDGTHIEFILEGYYFKVNVSEIFTSNSATYYAHIVMDSNVSDSRFPELKGTVTSSNFQGLTINQVATNGFKLYENGAVPDSSRIRFESNVVSFEGDYIIDCGFTPT